MAYKPMSFFEYQQDRYKNATQQEIDAANSNEVSLVSMAEYQNYLNNFSPTSSGPQVTPNVPMNTPIPTPQAPITPGAVGDVLMDGTPIAPGALAPNPNFAPPDAFGNFVEAGTFGGNQAAGIYAGGSVPKSFGGMTQQSFGAAQNALDSGLLGAAENAFAGQINNVNPYTSGLASMNPNGALNYRMYNFNDPYAATFSRLSGSSNPYGSQVARQAKDNPFGASFNTLAGSVNPYGNQIGQGYQSGNFNFDAGTNPYTSQVGGFQQSNPYQSAATNQGSNPYTNQIASSGGSNPFMDAVTQTGNNPFTDNLNFDQSNPFLQGFQGFADMQDSRLDSVVDKALGKVSDRVNSQFGLAGRTGSGAHQQLMTEGLGDVANQMYSDNFQQNANRALQALQSGAGVYDSLQGRNLQSLGMGIDAFNTDAARQLQGFGMGADIYNQDQSRNLDALTQAGQFADSDASRQLQGIGMAGDMFSTDASRNLDALTQAGQMSAQDRDAALMAQGMTADQFNTDQNRQLDYLNAASNIFDTNRAFQGDMYSNAANLFSDDRSRAIQALTQAGNFANQDFGNQLSAAAQGSGSWLANQGLNQDATRFNAGQFQNSFDNALSQYSQLGDMYQGDIDNTYRAASALPDLQQSNWNDAMMMNQFGQQWDDTSFYNSNPWTNLNNYANVIATLQGAVPTPEPGVSGVDRLMGLIPMLSLFKKP